jgi:hypothetical protein
MLFRRSVVGAAALAALLAGCNIAPLPQTVSPDSADPETPTVAAPYQPVMAGTAAHVPVGLKPWRELNDGVAPGAGRSP